MITAAILSGCQKRNHFCCGFISNPDFGKFGASYTHENGVHTVKSYIQSKMLFRTEYIYENFDISIPDSLIPGKRYSAAEPGVKLWYAGGGQTGQLETERADGFFIIKKVDDDSIELELSLKFSGFKKTEWHGEVPEYILREGTLTATKGYRLY